MIYYYAGSFDPITFAHIDFLKTLADRLHAEDKLWIGVMNEAEKDYKSSLENRADMINDAMVTKVKCESDKFMCFEQDTNAYKFLQDSGYKETEIIVCVGDDEWSKICSGKWVNWELLLKHYEFLVVDRNYTNENRPMPKGITPKVNFISGVENVAISSTQIRDILSRNPDCHYDDLKGLISHQTFRYIKNNELYWQNGNDYADQEKKFLADYEKKKKENNWSEPSVTTDVLAYNGDEILLIRRKNFPYRNYWCLVGGFMEKTDADLNYCAAREFKEETTLDIEPTKFRQIKAYGHDFDPRMKIVDVAFSVRVPKNIMKKAIGSDDAAEARWFNINDLPNLGFHHKQIIEDWKNGNE